MLKFSHRTLIYLSGLIWFVVGFLLLRLGLTLLMGITPGEAVTLPLISLILPFVSKHEQAVSAVLCIACLIGYVKGRFVLGKSVKKGVSRIVSFPNPTSLGNIYSAKYYILLGGMVGLGMSIKYLGLSNDVRGLIDVTIGIALLVGAMNYFRHASEQRA